MGIRRVKGWEGERTYAFEGRLRGQASFSIVLATDGR